MKKRLLTLVLVLALCLGLAVPAFAAGETVTVLDDMPWFGMEGSGKPLAAISHVYAQTEDGVFPNMGRTHGSYFCESGAAITLDSAWHTEEEYDAGQITDEEYEDSTLELIVWTLTEQDYRTKTLPTGTAEVVKGRSHALPDGIYLVEIARSEGPFYEINVIVGETGLSGDGYPAYPSNEAVDPNPPKPETTDPSTTTPVFADVKNTDWFADPVKWAVEQKITTGTTATTFSPTQDCSVAQILTFLWRAAGSPEAKAIEGMDENLYYAGAVAWAVEKGMISAEDFSATAPCTRSMAVQFIWQAAGSPKAGAATFTDVPADAEYANAVAWAVKEGVTTGTSDTTFAPDTVCNRGHIVTFLYRAFAK